ncbi:MAG TPA: gamma-glutamyl-gamma-aminobutyrate hydrolase family protein [Terriglobales bacterium]|nr:gamma-glutamyl-gamma-aminobutyrate hydrolase family protein [Terriglobales bacterium]
MAKLLVLQHVAHEILGTLNPLLKSHGFRIRYVNFGRHPDAQPSLDGYQGLVILGGPMGVYDSNVHTHLRTELKLIEQALEREMPMLGICLGAQLIAHSLGAEVKPNRYKEIGWYDVAPTAAGANDKMFAHFRSVERIFQWHGDTFDIPRGAAHLAASAACSHQAFRYGERVYGLQFHLEVDEAMIDRWLRVPVNREELSLMPDAIDPDEIRFETHQRIGRSMQLSDAVFGEFIKLFALRPKRVMLRSR